MPQSLSRILVHLIFSTKHRVPVISPAIQSELHPYLAVVLRDNECPSLQVGGVEDHVHLLFALSRTLTIARVVEVVKTSSSKWIKTKGPEFAEFHWQGGYGAFSVSQSNANDVIRYIRNQEEHHRVMSFQPAPPRWGGLRDAAPLALRNAPATQRSAMQRSARQQLVGNAAVGDGAIDDTAVGDAESGITACRSGPTGRYSSAHGNALGHLPAGFYPASVISTVAFSPVQSGAAATSLLT